MRIYITNVTGLKILKMSRQNPRSCKIFKIQDLTKKSKIDSKNIFVEHVDLLQAMLPATDQCPYSEVEALC